jgi:hypothetical protein
VASGSWRGYSYTIDARWAFTQALLDASSGQALVFDRNPNPNDAFLDSAFGGGPALSGTLPSIYISNDWSTALNPPWIDSITEPAPSNRTILDTIGQICLERHTTLNSTLYGSPFSNSFDHRVMTDVRDAPMPM